MPYFAHDIVVKTGEFSPADAAQLIYAKFEQKIKRF